MLKLVQSNRLDLLADVFIERLAAAPAGVFEPEMVIVPSAAIDRWLRLRIAGSRLGIAAGLQTGYPASYVWSLFGRVLDGLPVRSPLEPAVLGWRLARLLARLPADAAFAPVRRYLRDGDLAHRLELGAALAEQFATYAVYRPQWLTGWLAGGRFDLGEHEAWQAALWRAVRDDAIALPAEHPRERFFERIERDERARAKLPRRLTLFAPDTLAPLYFEVFERLARHVGTTVYLFNPSEAYWGLVVKQAAVERAARRDPLEAAYFERGHPLLAAWGQHGRDFVERYAARSEPVEAVDAYAAAGGATLLARLQDGVQRMEEGDPVRPAGPDDRSIALHSCHGPIRECEVLHDQLLAIFDADRSLLAEDVIVLAADLPAYAAAIDAVFGGAPVERRIPYAIADPALAAGAPLVRAFFALLDCARGRLDAPSVLDRLDEPRIAARFGIPREALARIAHWVEASGIRWGFDETTRKDLGLPATREHSWRAGFERLVLGAALAPAEGEPFAGVVPFEDLEGSDAALVGALTGFVDALARLRDTLHDPHTPEGWRDLLLRALDRFFEERAEDEDAARQLRAVLARLADDAAAGGFDDPVPANLFLPRLERAIAAEDRASGFMRGGVTFARLAIGRVVPARVVCLLGMNDGTIPKVERSRGFDLIECERRAHARRRGDRVPRDEDRYAVLAALLAARERLIVTYTGRALRDDKQLPPSVIVDELVQAIDEVAGAGTAAALRVEHPLQPFSAKVIDAPTGSPLFTYADEWAPDGGLPPLGAFAGALRVRPGAPGAPVEQWIATRPEPDIETAVTLDELVEFLANPARAFLRHRLGVRLAAEEETLEASEPFSADALDRFRMREALVAAYLAEAPGDRREEHARRVAARARAEGRLPAGPLGDVVLDGVVAQAALIERSIRALCDDAMPGQGAYGPAEATVLAIGPFRLAARFDRLLARPAGTAGALQVFWRPGRLRVRDRLHAWLHHLALAASGRDASTWLVAIVEEKGVTSVVETPFLGIAAADGRASETLRALLRLREAGLERLLPLPPRTGYAFAENHRAFTAGRGKAPRTIDGVREKAASEWHGGEYAAERNEAADAWFALASRDDPAPLDATFEALAMYVYGMLLDAQGDGTQDVDGDAT